LGRARLVGRTGITVKNQNLQFLLDYGIMLEK